MSDKHHSVYRLRNHPNRVFTLQASISKQDQDETVITAQISEEGKPPFTYVVEFTEEFVASKANFDGEMYLHTAVSVMQSQIESLRHRNTRLRVHRASGLIETSPLS
jgi:hypothetical protein